VALAVVVVVGDEEGCRSRDVDIVGGADQFMADGAEVFGSGCAGCMLEDLDLGAGFGDGGVEGRGIVVVGVGEVVDGVDVDGVCVGGRGEEIYAVGDEGTGEAI